MTRPVFAVVPNYNAADHLERLLPQLTDERQGYDEVIVVDDGSTDASQEVALAHNVTFVDGRENVGAAANRNRVLFEAHAPHVDEAILHFVDADMEVVSERTAERARELFTRGNVNLGALSGRIDNPGGTQMPFNFGPAFTLRSAASSMMQLKVAEIATTDPQRAAELREKHTKLLGAWPNTLTPDVARKTFWGAEGNLVIPAGHLALAGGFPELRHHETQGLAIELARMGFDTRYAPDIRTTHLRESKHRIKDQLEATVQLVGRYGLRRFALGGDNSH